MKKKDWEGCLSCPNTEVRTSRASVVNNIIHSMQRRIHCSLRRKFKGFDAVRIQHELDHLNGILIKDKGKVVKTMIYFNGCSFVKGSELNLDLDDVLQDL